MSMLGQLRAAGAGTVVVIGYGNALRGDDGAGPRVATASLGHTSDPRQLLALAQALYGRYPPAWLITIPGSNFQPGQALSVETHRATEEALRQIGFVVGQEQVWQP